MRPLDSSAATIFSFASFCNLHMQELPCTTGALPPCEAPHQSGTRQRPRAKPFIPLLLGTYANKARTAAQRAAGGCRLEERAPVHLHALTVCLKGGDGPRKLLAVASRGCAVRKCAHSHPCTLTRFCIGPGPAWGVVHRNPAAALPVQRARKATAWQRGIARRPLQTRAAIEMALGCLRCREQDYAVLGVFRGELCCNLALARRPRCSVQ